MRTALKLFAYTLCGTGALACVSCATRGNYAEHWGEFPYPTLDTIGYASSDRPFPDPEAFEDGRQIEEREAQIAIAERHQAYLLDQDRSFHNHSDEFITGRALNPTAPRPHAIEPRLKVSVPGHAFARR